MYWGTWLDLPLALALPSHYSSGKPKGFLNYDKLIAGVYPGISKVGSEKPCELCVWRNFTTTPTNYPARACAAGVK